MTASRRSVLQIYTVVVMMQYGVMLHTRADARRPIAIYAHFLTLSIKFSAN